MKTGITAAVDQSHWGTFWAVFGRAWQEILKCSHQDTIWALFRHRAPFGQILEEHSKSFQSMLIWASFRHFLEENGMNLQRQLIRAPFGQFLGGHSKSLQNMGQQRL